MEQAENDGDLRGRTQQFALRIIRLCERLPHRPAARVIGNQLFRSGTSVGANYGAVRRARSDADFTSKLGIVLEEADESVYWLELLATSGVVPQEKLAPLLNEAEQLDAIFAASRITAQAAAKAHAAG
jgi:four helix bundle protein